MKKLRAILSKGPDDFGAWLEGFDGIFGAGETPAEAVEDLRAAIAIHVEYNSDAPEWMKKGQYVISYKFDAQSMLTFYKGIFTNAAFERLTGINQKQIQHYASGTKKPGPKQLEKIETAIKKLGQELQMVELR